MLAAEIKSFLILPHTFITRECCFLHNNILMLRRLAMKLLLELSDESLNSIGNAVKLKTYFIVNVSMFKSFNNQLYLIS